MSREQRTENAAQQAKADEKVTAQRSVLHAALAEDRPRQQRLLDEMTANSATLQINRALFEYGDEARAAPPPSDAIPQTGGEDRSAVSLRAPSAVVQKLERFGPLTDEDRALLFQLVASEREVPAKVDLIREGDNPTHVHVVTGGLSLSL